MGKTSNSRADLPKLRSQFPLFANSSTLAYLDSAATSQKPKQVIDRLLAYYSEENANVHRGIYNLSETATAHYEESRLKIARFIGVKDEGEIIFTSGTTAGLNLVAKSWGETYLQPGDEILLPITEHHSNIVCWQMVAKKTGAIIRYIPLTKDFRLDIKECAKLITKQTKVLAFAHVSNVLGIIHPVKELVAMAHDVGAITVCDGAQAIAHLNVDVKDLGVDFYCFSGHKMCGPTGVGVLYGRRSLLEKMPPLFGGGDMIISVSCEGSVWAELPNKFEAGTPPIAQVIGLGASVDFLQSLDRQTLLKHEINLGEKALKTLTRNKHIKTFVQGSEDWVGIVTFHHEKIHPHDLAAILNDQGVCIRAGHHCAQPLMNYLGVSSTSRISPFMYNNDSDIERFLIGLEKAEQLFA